uniref:Soluble ligand binding domain-containing protein n=1 Tax=candidate division WOR-3 bacterium TaxID=2052148 RepID=A0A7C4CA49_UNCW3
MLKKTFVVLLFAAAALAQEQTSPGINIQSLLQAPVSPLASLVGVESPIISETYVLMPGDKLLVTVTGSVTYSYSAWVTYEGKLTINMPTTPFSATYSTGAERSVTIDVVDAVAVSGLTLEQAQDTLSRTFNRYFRDVRVKLTLTGLRSGIVFVTGEVQYPGAYNVSPVERVSQIITRAGGLAPLGSKTRIQLMRGGVEAAIVDIERFENDGDLFANPFVESGDVIHVPAVEGLVTVKGAVFGRGEYRIRASALTTEKERVGEGIYELKPGERVFDLVRKAGGITPWADLSNSYIERLVIGGSGLRTRIPIDLHRIIFERDSSQNLLLKNADIIVVPPINTLVYVEGEVNQPGSFTFTPNLRVDDYVGQAGGPTSVANVGRVYILRRGRRIPGAPNPVVEPGDIVMMPRQTFKWWQDYVTILSAVGIPIASILVTLTALNR